MTTSKIVIDADNGKLDAAADRSAKKVRGIADGARDINTQFDKLGKQIVQRVAGLTAMVTTIRAVGDEISKRQTATAEANRMVGGRTLGVGQSIRALGLDKAAGADAAFREVGQLTGQRSTDEVAAFLSQLASKQQGAKRKMKPDDIRQIMSLFATGLFTENELTEGAGSRRGIAGLTGQVTQRLEGLTAIEQAERRIRFQENTQTAVAQRTMAERGYRRRGAASDIALYEAQNPIAAGIVGTVRGATNLVGMGGVVDSAQNAAFQTMNATLKRIADNTAQKPTPQTQPTTEAGP